MTTRKRGEWESREALVEIAQQLADLGLPDDKAEKYFEFGEYATVELEIDSNLKIISGKILPL